MYDSFFKKNIHVKEKNPICSVSISIFITFRKYLWYVFGFRSWKSGIVSGLHVCSSAFWEKRNFNVEGNVLRILKRGICFVPTDSQIWYAYTPGTGDVNTQRLFIQILNAKCADSEGKLGLLHILLFGGMFLLWEILSKIRSLKKLYKNILNFEFIK